MNKICVFCGSSSGSKPEYVEMARNLGQHIAQANKTLVYGGGNTGLMGAIADSTLKNKGEVIGVIPDFMIPKEVAHNGLTQLHTVQSMHERKQKMAELADAFVALPGGLGTLEEFAEITTWIQLELIRKPIAILNLSGFYSPLLNQLDTMVAEGFLKSKNRSMIIEVAATNEVLPALNRYRFESYSIWDNLDRT